MPYKEFCDLTYNNIFSDEYTTALNGRDSASAIAKAERYAQKEAIKNTFKAAIDSFAIIDVADLWKAIYVSHLKRKAEIVDLNELDEEVIRRVISADQSWKKASGHAFESFIFEVSNPLLQNQNIKFLLQSQLTEMLRSNNIHNDVTDINWLNQKIHTDVFDLYAIVSWQEQNYVFGVIQSKTSIRDRVTRDREPSQQAMKASFWSIAVTLDGEFLRLPKFKEMVNGGGEDYLLNGWHGLYVMSNQNANDRIYDLDREFILLSEHAVVAARAWLSSRNRFDNNWRP